MRYPPEHRKEVRAAIIRAAARLFRERGYDGVGIDKIMESCGLTRGGFYGYFSSKENLLASVLAGEHDFIERLKARPEGDSESLHQGAIEVIDGYLAPENRDRVAAGCSIASLAADVGRVDGEPNSSYGHAVEELSAEFERSLQAAVAQDPRALATVAVCVGSLLVAHATGSQQLADSVQNAGRRAARVLMGLDENALSS